MSWPHLVLIGCKGQWVFNRGVTKGGGRVARDEWHGVQVVISASWQFQDKTNDEVSQIIVDEMNTLFDGCVNAQLKRVRVVTERCATFSATPGVDRFRPTQATAVKNLFLAGDWTQTGWPATMESAVRSGYLAAQEVQKMTSDE